MKSNFLRIDVDIYFLTKLKQYAHHLFDNIVTDEQKIHLCLNSRLYLFEYTSGSVVGTCALCKSTETEFIHVRKLI